MMLLRSRKAEARLALLERSNLEQVEDGIYFTSKEQ